MTMDYPAWLNASYVEKILRKDEKDESIKVSNITVKAATAKGDNYTSDMYRVAIDFDGQNIQEQKSLIVKVAPQDDPRKEMIEAAGYFMTEISMMSEILPEMSKNIENVCSTSLAARCLHVQYEKPTHLFIEDLAPRGFRMADRHTGMDLNHCLLAIRKLAAFHAASIALGEKVISYSKFKDPEPLTKYRNGLLRKEQSDVMTPNFSSSTKTLARETAKWPELSSRITEKLYKLSDALFEKGCEANLYREDDFNVLNHGDLWINNMLFRYDDDQKPTDIIFVDFQLSYYGSPAVDLLYFFGTSPTDEVRFHHRELLLREYHTSLASTLVKLECNTEVLSFEDLQEILKKRAFSEIVAAIVVFPFVALEKGEEIDLGDILKEKEYINPGYRGRRYIEIMSKLLPWYDSMGLLDA